MAMEAVSRLLAAWTIKPWQTVTSANKQINITLNGSYQ
jgi:hypothetical protein